MGSTRRRHRAAALLFAAVQVGLSFGLTADLVLCRTAAGQVEIESAISGGCCESHGIPGPVAGPHGADECGCVDTPLLQTPIDNRTPLTRASACTVASLHGAHATLPAPPVRLVGRAAHPPRPPHDRLTAIRSVVLLV